MSSLPLVLIDVRVSCSLLCTGDSSGEGRMPRQFASAQSRCIRCNRRFDEPGMTSRGKVGEKHCHPRCKNVKHSITDTPSSSTITVPPPAKKQRRTKSDAGQPIIIASTRLRIRASKPPPPPPKPKLRPVKPSIDLSALLDATHARRMALIEAEQKQSAAAVTHTTAHNTSSVLWQ